VARHDIEVGLEWKTRFAGRTYTTYNDAVFALSWFVRIDLEDSLLHGQEQRRRVAVRLPTACRVVVAPVVEGMRRERLEAAAEEDGGATGADGWVQRENPVEYGCI